MTTLETARLILRPWREADLEPFAAMSADPRVMKTLMGPLSRDQSDNLATRLKSHIEEHDFGLWAMELPGVASFIGFTGLQYVNFDASFVPAPPARVVEIGWRLAHEHWGKGYASEAARASLDYAFGPLNLDEIIAFTAVTNERSRGVMSRLGMTRDPACDFDHPRVPDGYPLKRHMLYRIGRGT
ncbi:MAG: GNAT family N-acetyltransferase [Alphaproteobacteria bacterium HGW-Alphaproteobacteria-12]|nr:MAG: GNAT family N-acetyltransferase [Alphaproteobacteria bacterium HGW-Alphaproteobacteria-12]